MSSNFSHTKVGVLALQGDFREHLEVLRGLGADAIEVRLPEQLAGVDGIVLPGGESTAISKLLISSGLFDEISSLINSDSVAVMGTCAGVILSAREVRDGIPVQRSFGAFDAVVKRNGVGPQRFSSEELLTLQNDSQPVVGVFIRPPVIESVGESVEVLAELRGSPVLCTQGRHLFATFHPELTADNRVHRLFLERLQS